MDNYGSSSEPKEMEEGSELRMLASDLMGILESSILTFHLFLKMDKKRVGNGLHLFGNQNHAAATPLQQVQSSLEKVRITSFIFYSINPKRFN